MRIDKRNVLELILEEAEEFIADDPYRMFNLLCYYLTDIEKTLLPEYAPKILEAAKNNKELEDPECVGWFRQLDLGYLLGLTPPEKSEEPQNK